MKVGMIGLGDIAQKAYLPVLGLKPEIDLVLCTRKPETLTSLADKYRIKEAVHTVDELIGTGIKAAFVHSATETHREIAEKLMNSGIHVYVDKPWAYSFEEAESMAETARRTGQLLMTGFNRRFAPMIRALKDQAAPDLILMQKNRVALPGEIRNFIFDDFIHVVDTLRFLLGTAITHVSAEPILTEGKLSAVTVRLQSQGAVAIGIMNRRSGTVEEIVEYMCPDHKLMVRNLNQTTHWHKGLQTNHDFGDWETTLHRRGFPQIVNHFLTCAESGQPLLIPPEDALITHRLCEKITNLICTSHQ